jgi:hypothetical protein
MFHHLSHVNKLCPICHSILTLLGKTKTLCIFAQNKEKGWGAYSILVILSYHLDQEVN